MTRIILHLPFLLMMIALSSTIALGQEPAPTPLSSPPGGKPLKGTKEGASATKKTEPIQIRFRVYSNNKIMNSGDVKRLESRLVEAIDKWTSGFENNSGVEFQPPAKPLAYDLEEVMFRRTGKRKKHFLRFATKLSSEPKRGRSEWIKQGTDNFIEGYLHTYLSEEREKEEAKKIDQLPYTFHIIVVKNVAAKPKRKDALVKGKWIENTNVIFLAKALASSGTKYKEHLFHEVGHLFGLGDHNNKEHKESWGIMMKYPIDPNTKQGSYGDEEEYGWKREKTKTYRIKQMKARFGL